ncbi:MAG: oligoendopeptidase F [Eubacteriales bacterium]|nr:oligoendopeptidase F [Eubacteriales bacterium]
MSAQTLLPRAQMDQKYCWRLEDIFATDEQWETFYQETCQRARAFSRFSGTLGASVQSLKAGLDEMAQLLWQTEKLYVYARMRRDEDNANAFYQGLADRAASLNVELGSELSFVEPELLGIAPAVLDDLLTRGAAELRVYQYYLDTVRRRRAHTLDAAQEKLLAMAGELGEAPSAIYSMLNDADLNFPAITDENGQTVQITHGRFIPLMESADRNVRKAAYEGVYTTYGQFRNTLAATYSSSVKSDVFFAKTHAYGSALLASLDGDAVPQSVYDTLIKAVRAHLPEQHRYMRLRRSVLQLDELHLYDIYTPMVKDSGLKYTYSQAKELVYQALAPLGDDYIAVMREGVEKGGWVDVYENQNKTSGAYSWGIWGTHPYVLLNWSDTLDNAFTLAHELGHAMHTHLADSTQTFLNSQYPLLLAEIASTTNETLLANYLLKTLTDPRQRIYLVNYMLEQIRTTVIRQTMFAEFEKETHAMSERGEALTAESLCTVYRQLVCDYFGPDVVADDFIALEWARVPHFYRAFYVYKYAIGFSCALNFASMVEQGAEGRESYLDFLRAGGSDYPLELLKKAGINLAEPDTVEFCLNRFSVLLDQLENLLDS